MNSAIPMKKMSESNRKISRKKLPMVSVIVPIRNEARSVKDCLRSLLANRYPKDRMEILVVDGHSTDGTQDELLRLGKKDKRIKLLHNPGRYVPNAMNIGIRNAKGEIILRADAHTVFDKNYVQECVRTLSQKGCDNAGGPMRARGRTHWQKAVSLATSSLFGVGDSAFHFEGKEGFVDTVYLGAYPRHVFKRIGLFDESFIRNQDDEFNYRLRKAGGKIFLSSRIRSMYYPRANPVTLWKQYFGYGFWKVAVARRHWEMMRWRHFIPAVFVLSLGAAVLLGIAGGTWCVLAVLSGTYGSLALACSIRASLREDIAYLFTMPIVFLVLHVSYGCGFIAGSVSGLTAWAPSRRRSHA